MWRQRFKRFVAGFWQLASWDARWHFILWGLRRFLQLVLLELAQWCEERGPQQAGVPANVRVPIGIQRANDLGYSYYLSLRLDITNCEPHLNFILPTITPGIIFGGYISCFNFAYQLLKRGYPIRFIVVEHLDHTQQELVDATRDTPAISHVLQEAEIVKAIDHIGYLPIPVSRHDAFLGYSAFTTLLAHRATQKVSSGKFIFYIQEEEGHFHAHNSLRATIEYIYTLPHIAIFNSPMLAHYFRMHRMGVFSQDEKGEDFLIFRHALTNNRYPTMEEIRGRSQKKLLFFARPEQHAERNLFEIGLVALRYCCNHGLFKPVEWVFHGIGALTSGYSLDLGAGNILKFLEKKSPKEYAELLYQYDVGLSLMYAPHPSVPNFEMAAAGMPTVTTTFENRPKEVMETVCPNLIAVPPHIEGVIAGIKEAVSRVTRYEDRVTNARFEWPRIWEETFDERFMRAFERLAAQHFPMLYQRARVKYRSKHLANTVQRFQPVFPDSTGLC
jgi:hypothetical protein